MKAHFISKFRTGLLLAALILGGVAEAQEIDTTTLAKRILDGTGTRGGIIVHLGCGDGRLCTALGAGESYTVHGLESDPAKVGQARAYIKASGSYGQVSVEQFSASKLPYTDNLINLIVVRDAGKVTIDEMMRVLIPGGSIRIRRDNKWETINKPWPDNIDQWTHFLHDATNNAVAAIMFPVTLSIANVMHLDPRPFLMTLAIAASACYATPIGYQTNLMVYGPGGYRFKDFLKIGIPVSVFVGVIAVTIIYFLYFN